jgi:ribonuclease Z
MKPSFHTRLLNGPFEDPGLYVRLLREGRALLFDIGYTNNISVRDALKVSDIFLSHTHIDHFIGFDSILRLHLKRESPLRLYGPEGFIDHVEGKLRSYTWNLIGDYPLVIEVSEIDERFISKAVFKASNSFERENGGGIPFEGLLIIDSFFKVSAAILDHQIPCLAFCLQEDYHINIDKAKLKSLNLPVGPWLGGLKTAIRKNLSDSVFKINGKEFTFAQLKDINIRKITALALGSDILYIEAYFLDKDRHRAQERCHLTAKQAGRIAREAGIGKLVVFHFSPKYTDAPEELVEESEAEFHKS